MASISPSIPPTATRVLVVDDEPGLRQVLSIAFRRQGYEVALAPGAGAALEAIRQNPQPFPLILTDLVMPDGSGIEVLAAAKARSSATEVIVMTAHSTVESALDAMRRGAYDFVTKPFSPAEVIALAAKALEKSSIVAENQRLRAQLERLDLPSREPLGTSPAMQRISELIGKIAPTRTTVLITGESGTGKERVARAIHEQSDRAAKPFLVVNCGALPEALMESELFGHEKGSFTGAGARALGLFREADGGTLLLDEVGELPASLQVKLLRVLQERKVRPVGAAAEIAVDVRVLAATNREVEVEVREGRFRQDLYYRLNVIRIELPPLRERPGDVSRLAERFLRRFAAELGKDVRGLTTDAMRALDAYGFPGNVRELENMMERAVALAGGPSIGLGDLPSAVAGLSASPAPLLAQLPPGGCMLDEVLGEVERRLILQALERTGGVRKAAAKLLGVSFRSLRYRLAKHALASDGDSDDDLEGGSRRESSPPGAPQ
ncbi:MULTISPECIES: sigma-54 dependent transcriptional regulator [Sorangium]|uniref:Fis family transcriptional regulator n=1 Tax=Sorangium cellulosum TaxID=56 RepID=A0A4P2QTN2_SORCE|nr:MULTISPECIES: sigma-54 dependent transcriptional regulator [Sorangium]AUX33411.1 Fis family transcriptional regulator [Sorangium cellulosum]WCQ92727.1 Regulatory protein AtoC [Sorangium sp. Soce836]